MSQKSCDAWNLIDQPEDLLLIKNSVYDPCQLQYSQPIKESESAEYAAFEFSINDFFVRFRIAKITPTKIGQFVTFWKRVKGGPIQPYDFSDAIDFLLVCVRKDNHFGQFIFPKSVLAQQGVLSSNGKGGKRALRVYPPWDEVVNAQAKKTQQWQLEYFLEIPKDGKLDCNRARSLYALMK